MKTPSNCDKLPERKKNRKGKSVTNFVFQSLFIPIACSIRSEYRAVVLQGCKGKIRLLGKKKYFAVQFTKIGHN